MYDADICQGTSEDATITAAVALCRTFVRLMSSGRMTRKHDDDATEVQIVKWLRERYVEYLGGLGRLILQGEVGYTLGLERYTLISC